MSPPHCAMEYGDFRRTVSWRMSTRKPPEEILPNLPPIPKTETTNDCALRVFTFLKEGKYTQSRSNEYYSEQRFDLARAEASWIEYQRLRERLTMDEKDVLEKLHNLHKDSAPPYNFVRVSLDKYVTGKLIPT